MNKTVLAMLLSSLTTSAWWAVAMWPGLHGLVVPVIILTAVTIDVLVNETLDILNKP